MAPPIDFEFLQHDLPQLLAESRAGASTACGASCRTSRDSRRTAWRKLVAVRPAPRPESTIGIVWNEVKYKAELERSSALPLVECLPRSSTRSS